MVIDEGEAGAGADIRREGRRREEVIEEVGHERDCWRPVVANRRSGRTLAGVGMVERLDLDARADEVVADLAADGPARIHGVAVVVQQPVQAAFGADIDTRIGRAGRVEQRLGISRRRQGEDRLRRPGVPSWTLSEVPLLGALECPNNEGPKTVVAHGHRFRRLTTGALQPCNTIRCQLLHAYCMNQPWLTTIDWPVSAVLLRRQNRGRRRPLRRWW